MSPLSSRRDTFVALVRQAARDRKISVNRFFINAEEYGLKKSWLHDRYYGKTGISYGDIEQVQLVVDGEIANTLSKSRGSINNPEEAIAAFCRMCVGEDIACRFKNCELRKFSPFPYVKYVSDPDEVSKNDRY